MVRMAGLPGPHWLILGGHQQGALLCQAAQPCVDCDEGPWSSMAVAPGRLWRVHGFTFLTLGKTWGLGEGSIPIFPT